MGPAVIVRYRGDLTATLRRRVIDLGHGYIVITATTYDPTTDRTTADCERVPSSVLVACTYDESGQPYLPEEVPTS
jgi:hypothetical protein